MSKIDERKKGFEAKYVNDQEFQFKLRAVRNKYLGKWASEKIQPDDEEEYIKSVRLSDLEKPGDDDIIEKLEKDFESKNIEITRDDILKKISECESIAFEELKKNE